MKFPTRKKPSQSQSGTGHSESESSWTYTAPDEGQATQIKIRTPYETPETDICERKKTQKKQ